MFGIRGAHGVPEVGSGGLHSKAVMVLWSVAECIWLLGMLLRYGSTAVAAVSHQKRGVLRMLFFTLGMCAVVAGACGG
jgi:hypothetical protein